MGQRLANIEIDKRVNIRLDKSIKKDGVNGLMLFGLNNDYPQIIEKLINSSVTAKAVCGIYAKFLTGMGFENETINNIEVGKDQRGKQITILSLLREVAFSAAKHNGFYIHRNVNPLGQTGTVHLKPFKDCRFSKPDDNNYSAKILYYDNWAKDSDWKQYDKKQFKDFHIFNSDIKAVEAQFEEAVKKGYKYKGQIYHQFMDDQYFYPLSIFDSVYLDMDTEAQIEIYKNNEIRNGFMKKTVVRTAPGGSETDKRKFKEVFKHFLGPDGENSIIIEDDVNENNEISESSAFKIDNIESNVDDKLFESWEISLKNNIRKAAKGIPEVLIDYEAGKLGTTSGEAIIQATNFYNAITSDDRALISNSFKEIFSLSDNPILRDNQNWNIKPLKLIKDVVENVDEIAIERAKAQSTLKGSVGGVTALIQLQQSVSQGASDLESAIEIVKEIYGIPEETARKMIGTPKINQDVNNNTQSATGN